MIAFIFLICALGRFISAEPRCSRFEYEEKTLEKMIRTEILVEQVMSDIESVKQQTKNAVSVFERMKLELKEDFNSMLEETNKKVVEWKGNFVVKPSAVFLVKDPTTQAPGNGNVMVFDTVMSDTTGSYDNKSGLFTVPVEGSYLFTAQLCLNVGKDKHIHYAIVAGENQVANSLLYDTTHRFCNTAQAVVNLKKGQTVYVLSRATSSTPLRYNHAYEWSTFSGILIN